MSLGDTADDCPLKKCDGQMVVEGYGRTDDGRPIEWTICDQCGRTREHIGPLIPADHPTLGI